MTDPRRAKLDSLADSTEKLRKSHDRLRESLSGKRPISELEQLRHELRWALSVIEHEVPCPDCREYVRRCQCPGTSKFARHYDASRDLVGR